MTCVQDLLACVEEPVQLAVSEGRKIVRKVLETVVK